MARAALLDVDGTLLVSNHAHAESWHRAFAAFGYEVPIERLERLIGMGSDKLIASAVPGLAEDAPPGSAIAELRRRLFREEYVNELVPTPGARDLLFRLRDDGYRLIAATSAQGEELENLLKAADVSDLLQGEATTEDAGSSKPDPDVVHDALHRANVSADDAVLLGDTPYDVGAARRADVACVALRCGGWNDDALAGAAAIYDDPADLLRHYDGSPFSRVDARTKPR